MYYLYQQMHTYILNIKLNDKHSFHAFAPSLGSFDISQYVHKNKKNNLLLILDW